MTGGIKMKERKLHAYSDRVEEVLILRCDICGKELGELCKVSAESFDVCMGCRKKNILHIWWAPDYLI